MEDSEAELYFQFYIDNLVYEERLKNDDTTLPQLIIFVLLEIGFDNFEIQLIKRAIDSDKKLSYSNLKLLGISNEKISALFYLFDPDSFMKELKKYCINDGSKEICSVCLNSLGENIKLQCNHRFHIYCISKWKNTCPYCRQPFENEFQYPKLIVKWLNQSKNNIFVLNDIKEQCNIGIKIEK